LEYVQGAIDIVPEQELTRMFNQNVKAGDGKMTFSDFIRMVVSHHSNFDLRDSTMQTIEKTYLTPRNPEKN